MCIRDSPSVCAGHGKISMSCRLPIPLVLAGRYLCIGGRCIAFLHPGLLRAAPAPHVHEPAGYGGSSAGIPAGPVLTPGERTPSRKALPMNTCGLLNVMKCFTFIRCRKNSCWSSCRRRTTTAVSYTHLDVYKRQLVVGGSGAGKTRGYCVPNILEAAGRDENAPPCSLVVTDPKSEVLRKTGALLIARGYEVRVLDLTSPAASFCYNPLRLSLIHIFSTGRAALTISRGGTSIVPCRNGRRLSG